MKMKHLAIASERSSSRMLSTHHGVQQGRQCAGHLANTRHGAYLKYTNIVLESARDPTGKPTQSAAPAVSPFSGTPGTTADALKQRSVQRNAEVSPEHHFRRRTRQTCENHRVISQIQI
ncbi:hypothetical protein TNCV_316931 [Trichonephila clavipes]|nr:hypothetical protein TNCV_316931 [Trichonephila clavipes]